VEKMAMTDSAFWRGKKVFLTGHTGFKGGWTALVLESFGAKVKGYSLPAPSEPSLFQEAGIEKSLQHQIGDIRDLETLRKSLAEFQPEIVLHMAAQPLVRESYVNPLETFSTNVMGTAHILEAIRTTKSVRSVVIVTTDKCYENREWLWPYREDEAMGGKDPYSSSKGCAELVTSSYRFSFFQNKGDQSTYIATARAGNVVGGGDWAKDRLVPDLIRTFMKGESQRIRSPKAIRPWQHVLEPISGYLLLAEKLFTEGKKYAEAWNFGPQESDTREVSYVVDQLVKLWGPPAKWELDGDEHPHEASLLKLDISKAKHLLEWKPKWHIDQCLDLTAGWYKAYYKNPKAARALCLEQIHSYFGYESRKGQ
jgi:CDP-glucose 4,6-dehydratase